MTQEENVKDKKIECFYVPDLDLKKDIPSTKTIIRAVEKLGLERFFKTDSLRRLYDWQSLVNCLVVGLSKGTDAPDPRNNDICFCSLFISHS